jgi:ketosteroid isomerase-like protein
MSEWLKETGCKPVGYAYAGSNPAPPTLVASQRIEQLRAAIEAFNRTGQLTGRLLARDFEMEQASSIIDTQGVFTGPDAVRGSLDELDESFEELSFEAEEFLEAPDGTVVVLVRARGRGRRSGVEMDNHIAWVWTFRDDKATRLVVYEEPDEALEAVGLKK